MAGKLSTGTSEESCSLRRERREGDRQAQVAHVRLHVSGLGTGWPGCSSEPGVIFHPLDCGPSERASERAAAMVATAQEQGRNLKVTERGSRWPLSAWWRCEEGDEPGQRTTRQQRMEDLGKLRLQLRLRPHNPPVQEGRGREEREEREERRCRAVAKRSTWRES